MGEALARTSRQVNTLERRLQPALSAYRIAIRRTLDEREREDHGRLERLTRDRR
ncbi:MAG: V-type ATP synthase subunit D [Gemmatimonadales bacterium]